MRSKAVPYDDSRRDVDALTPPAGFGPRTGAWFVHELGEMLPPTPMRRRFSKAAGRPPFIRSEFLPRSDRYGGNADCCRC